MNVLSPHSRITDWKPSLIEGVRVSTQAEASGRTVVMLEHPANGNTLVVTEAQREFALRLQGELTVHDALSAVMREGWFPPSVRDLLHDLARAGFLNQPREEWEPMLAPEAKSAVLGSRLQGILGLLAGIRSIPLPKFNVEALRSLPIPRWVKGRAFFVCLVLGGLFGSLLWLYHALLAGAPPAGESLGFWALALTFFGAAWLGTNFAALIEGASIAGGDPGWKLRLGCGVPTLAHEFKPSRNPLSFEAIGSRFGGIAALAFVATLLTLVSVLGVPSVLRQTSFVAAGGLLAACYWRLSPWWRAPVTSLLSDLANGLRLPGDLMCFLKFRLIPILFRRDPPDRAEVVLLASSLYALTWTVFGFRGAAYLVRRHAPLFVRDAIQGDSLVTSRLLMILVGTFGSVVILGLIAASLFYAGRLFRWIGSWKVWSAPGRATTGWAAVGAACSAIAVLAPESLRPPVVAVSFLALTLLVPIRSVMVFRSEREGLMPAVFGGLGIWSVGVAYTTSYILWIGESTGDALIFGIASWGIAYLVVATLLPIHLLRVRGGQRAFRIASYIPLALFIPLMVAAVGIGSFYDGLNSISFWSYVAGAILMLVVATKFFGGHYRSMLALCAISGLVCAALTLRSWTPSIISDAAVALSPAIPALILAALGMAPFCLVPSLTPPRAVPNGFTSDIDRLRHVGDFLWAALQAHVLRTAGERAAMQCRDLARAVSKSFDVGLTELIPRRGESADNTVNPDITRMGDELQEILMAASRGWVSACGQSAVRRCAEGAFEALPSDVCRIAGEYVFRKGGWFSGVGTEAEAFSQVDLDAAIGSSPVFSERGGLHAFQRSDLKLEFHRAGTEIVRQGERGQSMFVIARGRARVSERDLAGREHVKAQLRPGDHFGQIALLYDVPRTATVTAMTDLWALRLDAQDYRRMCSADDLGKSLPEEIIARINRLHDIPLFRELSPGDLECVTSNCAVRHCDPGEVIIAEGEASDDFYVIDKGEVEVSRAGEAVRTQGAGETFGEIALIFNVPRTATVTARSECRLLKVSASELRPILAKGGMFATHLKLAAQRRVSA